MAIKYNTSIVRNGLVLHLDAANPKSYPGSGTTWFDLSSNRVNGTFNNGPTFNSANNGSFAFDGINDDILAPVTFSVANTTVSFWIYLDPSINWATRFDMMSGSIPGLTNGRFLFYMLSSTVLEFYMYFPSGTPYVVDITNANTLFTGNWNHVTMTSSTPSSSTTMALYRNGSLVNTTIVPEAATATSTALYLMRNQSGANPTKGKISNTMIYNRALSATEVAQNFEAMRGRYGV